MGLAFFSQPELGGTNPMSHIVTIQTKLHDPTAIGAACRRLNLAEPTQGTAKLYKSEATGLIVKLKDWSYPVVIDLASGNVQYDTFNGEWGEQQRLDAFLQAYSVEKAKLEARRTGHVVTEQALTDGSIKLTIQVA
jgi:hypothetical protein